MGVPADEEIVRNLDALFQVSNFFIRAFGSTTTPYDMDSIFVHPDGMRWRTNFLLLMTTVYLALWPLNRATISA
jgi:hypothetical protein